MFLSLTGGIFIKKSIRAAFLVLLSVVLVFGGAAPVRGVYWGKEPGEAIIWFRDSPYMPNRSWSSWPEDVRDFFGEWMSEKDSFDVTDPDEYDIIFHDFLWNGDADGDGTVNLLDAQNIMKLVCGWDLTK